MWEPEPIRGSMAIHNSRGGKIIVLNARINFNILINGDSLKKKKKKQNFLVSP